MATSIGAQLTGALLDRLSGRYFERHSALVNPICDSGSGGPHHPERVAQRAAVLAELLADVSR